MAARSSVKLADLVIPSGTSVSNIWTAREVYGDAERVLLAGEDVVDGVITYTVEVTDDITPAASGTWRTFQILNGATLADFVPSNLNTKAFGLPQDALAATGIRIKSSANVTANRIFGASKQYFS